jgi:hypothetical protein
MHFLDIICYFKGQAADPFTALSRLYHLHISSRENKFMAPVSDPIVNPNDSTKKDYELKLTLLPHQIIIIPSTFLPLVTWDEADDLEQIDKYEIR